MNRYEQMRQKCIEFHSEHPEVWRLFCKFAFNRIALGCEHYSARSIFERIRWETEEAAGTGANEFKLNNNFHPFYARAFMKVYPQHNGFFRLREQTSKVKDPSPFPELGPDYWDRGVDAHHHAAPKTQM